MDSGARAEDSSSASVKLGAASNELYLLAKNAALNLVARAEQCTFLFGLKLRKKGFDKALVQRVIEELTEENAVNNRRFALMWVKSRVRGHADSPRRMTMALYAKGIDKKTAAGVIEECLDGETEAALIEKFAARYCKKYCKTDENLNSFLRAEGFSKDAVIDFIEALENGQD